MPLYVRDAGVFRTAIVYVRDAGVWKLLLEGYARVNGVWERFLANLAASNPGAAFGQCFRLGAGNCNAVTNTVTTVVSGGSGSYTYLWEQVSGTSASVGTNGNPTTAFSRTAAVGSDTNEVVGVYRCRVTDNVTGLVVNSPDFSVTTWHTNTQ